MANSKISALPSATTPLAGTEVLPIVQSGGTDQVSVANLTAGRAVSMLSATAGNVQISGNTIASTNVNGAVTIAPNGIGAINLTTSDKVTISNSTTTADLYVSAAGTQTNILAVANRGPAIDLWNSQSTDGNFSTIEFQKATGTSIAKIAAQTVSQAGRTGYLSFMTANGAAPDEKLTINATGVTTVKTDNLVFGTAAKGINFTANTPAAGMTSQLLNWYEEGTWTPNNFGGLGVIGTFSSSGRYIRIGKMVTVTGNVAGSTSVSISASGIISSNLPFNASVDCVGSMANANNNAGGNIRIAGPFVVAVSTIAATTSITFTATYFV